MTGIYLTTPDAKLNSKNGFPVCSTRVEANHVTKRSDNAATMISDEEKKIILAVRGRGGGWRRMTE